MAAAEKIHIIGIGEDGLLGVTASARRLIEEADLLIGAPSTLDLIPKSQAKRLELGGNLNEAVVRIEKSPGERMVVLASGDPLFYGIARYLCDRLGKDRFEVLPHVSSMQTAFARVKETWEDAYLTNLASHPLEQVIEKIRIADTVGMFTSEDYSPSVVARELLAQKINYFSAYVCENLGSPDERVTQGELADLTDQEFSPLNVMILVRKPALPDEAAGAQERGLFGNPDHHFLQSRPKQGLLTPSEVRAIALAQLRLKANSIVWDVGAGSGSVAIEAAQLAHAGTVYAVEMDAQDHELLKSNAQRFGVKNLVPVLGRAPAAWEELPAPDCIFVGGSGREISRLVDLACERLKPGGRLVANVGSIENLSAVQNVMHKHVPDVQVWMINVARGTQQLERVRFDALNPTFLLGITRPAKA